MVILQKGPTAGFWILNLLIAYRYLNNNKEELIMFWLKMTGSVPIDNKFQLAGISKQKNKAYWIKQNKFNALLSRLFHVYHGVICFIFTLPLYFMRYDANLLIFILNLIMVIIHYW